VELVVGLTLWPETAAPVVPAMGAPASAVSILAAVNSARPPGAVAVRFPRAPAAILRPRAAVASRNRRSAGFAAAAAFLATSISLNPPWLLTVTTRSTPGRTPRYVAVSPDTRGAGRANGTENASRRPEASVSTASGPRPPADRISPEGVAAGR
jgi:hypothetical protein